MKRGDLIRHLQEFGCTLKREGAGHSLWMNPITGEMEAVPRLDTPTSKEHGILKILGI